GAGHTEKAGPHAEVVRRAEEWLMKQQKPNGAVSRLAGDGRLGYNHAIAGLALAEAWGMGGDQRIRAAAQKAVDYSIRDHQAKYSGWRYSAREAADTSVTGWFVMQLKSARMAGLAVDGSGFQGASAFLDSATTKDGYVGYVGAEGRDACLTSVGMVCRQFMSMPADNPTLVSAAGIVSKALPEWNDARGHSRERGFYYWYYGTLAMFQHGGEAWTKWNAKMKPVLVDNQCKGGPTDGSAADKDGSWDPTSWIDKHGGRVFTTAMGALTLEVYYRYLPMYAK
ncbi:MAG TPA: hypothetical protein PK280_19885, partial [Planctomycetota bacterium]|nr:hypothetical protein [Planctomycetota bacterium]